MMRLPGAHRYLPKGRNREGRLLTRERQHWSLIKSEDLAKRRKRLTALEKTLHRAQRRLVAALISCEEIDAAIRVLRELHEL